MPKQHKWLHEQLARWREEGLIDAGLAGTLATRYPLPEGRAWGQLIFSAFGAIVAGLGVILFFAYNWEALPKVAKLALVFGAIAAAHGGGLWARPRSQPLSEGLHALGTMLFGAGIWLVAQVYHIDEHYPNGILLWSLGALALAWALPSLAQGLMAALLIGLWVGFEALDFGRAVNWAPLMAALGLPPLAWLMRSRVLLFFSLAALFGVLIMATFQDLEEVAVAAAFLTGTFYLFAGFALSRSPFAEAAPVARILGFVIYLAFLFAFSFEGAVDILSEVVIEGPVAAAYFAVPLLLTLGAAAWSMRDGPDGLGRPLLGHWAAALLAVLMVTGLALAKLDGADAPAAIAANLLFLAHCLFFIREGCRRADAVQVSIACILFAALVLARYADLFVSLLARSVVFLLLGAALFGAGNLYARAKRRLQAEAA